ncbi:hypothetical protein PybrP1_001015 [[Pythium] brassicae (nom. inval.)]|nr:hypothetical protein PybrP1_001015 [[Pythium] brassicae (nom. inval.)]
MDVGGKVQDVVPFEGRFPSWEAFDVARKAHGEKTHTLYVCRNTVKVAVANKRRKLQVPESWVYDRKVFVCTHGYRRISRSSGSRPRQKVRYTSCKARFTASIVCEFVNSTEVLCIKVTAQHLEHDDHPVSLDQWRHYSQNRASIVEHPYLIHEAELMRRVGSNKRTARAHIETLSGKVCTMKDMHNLYARLKKREDGIKTNSALVDENPAVRVESVLQQFVDAHVENHVSILSADDGSNEAMCLSSKAMKEHFQVFPELCLLDVTICPQHMDGYQMQGFLSMDALGNAKPPEFDVPSLALQEQVRELMKQMVFTHTHETYNESKALLLQHLGNRADHPLLLHIDQHWEPYRNLWASYWRGIVLEFSAFFNKGMECFWNPLKNAFDRTGGGGLNRNATGSSGISAVADAAATAAAAAACASSGGDNGGSNSASPRDRYSNGADPKGVGAGAGVEMCTGATATSGISGLGAGVGDSGGGVGTTGAPVGSSGGASVQRESITKCISEVLTMIKFVEEEWTSKMMILEMTKPLTEFSSDPLLHYMVNCLSSFAVGLISSQIMALNADSGDHHNGMITLMKGPPSSLASVSTSSGVSSPATGATPMEAELSLSSSSVAAMALDGSVTSVATNPGAVGLIASANGSVHHGHDIVDVIDSTPRERCEPPTATMELAMTMAMAPPPAPGAGAGAATQLSAASLAAAGADPAAYEPATVIWIDRSTRKTHVMQRDCSACDCEFYELYQLPCQHLIWYELSVLKSKQVSMSAVGARWFLRTFQYPKIVSQRESNEIEYHIL